MAIDADGNKILETSTALVSIEDFNSMKTSLETDMGELQKFMEASGAKPPPSLLAPPMDLTDVNRK